jgi:dTDP-4-dehydrorhamnose 3,5-epimerase
VSKFVISPTPLKNLTVIQRQRIEDHRGFFSRFFCAEELAPFGFNMPVAQMNHTLTARMGAVRGLHFQHQPYAEDKIISCLHGTIFDVAVDLRRGSPTFLRWHAEILSGDNGRSLLVPQGFAHGFQTLSEGCELLYLHSRPYAQHAEGALNVADPLLAIDWPLPICDLSARDSSHSFLSSKFTGI